MVDTRTPDPRSSVYVESRSVEVAAPPRQRISWPAVFAGAILALVVGIALSLLGTGIGASTIDPLQGTTPGAKALGTGAAIWLGVSSLVALFIGGWVAGHLAGMPRSIDGMLHGLLVWGLATVASLYVAGSLIGSVVGKVTGVVGAVAGTVASGAAAGATAIAPELMQAAKGQLAESGVSWDGIKREVQTLLAQTGKPALQPGALEQRAKDAVADTRSTAAQVAATPTAADTELNSLLERLFAKGSKVATQADRDAVINVLVARTGMTREEAARRVTEWEAAYEQARMKYEQTLEEAKAKARQVADAAAEATARAAFWGFVAMLIGAIAAGVGGSVGRPRHVVT